MTKTRLIIWLPLIITLGAWVASASNLVRPKGETGGGNETVSIGNDFHISLMDGSIVFYNNTGYGPYRGSMIDVMGAPNGPTVQGFGMGIVVYFRDIQWPNGDRLWTLMVSLFVPMFFFALVVGVYEYRRSVLSRRNKKNACPSCGYPRHGLQTQTTHCPECGHDLYTPY